MVLSRLSFLWFLLLLGRGYRFIHLTIKNKCDLPKGKEDIPKNCSFNRFSARDHQHQGLFLEIHTKNKLDVWLFNQKLSSWKPFSRLSTLIIIIMIIMIIKQSFELQPIVKQQTIERRMFCFTWWWLSFMCILDYHCSLLSSQAKLGFDPSSQGSTKHWSWRILCLLLIH